MLEIEDYIVNQTVLVQDAIDDINDLTAGFANFDSNIISFNDDAEDAIDDCNSALGCVGLTCFDLTLDYSKCMLCTQSNAFVRHVQQSRQYHGTSKSDQFLRV